MVLGLKNKNRRGPCTQIEYLIHVQEIKPWPPTQSLKHVRSVLIQWENGERNSGSTASVTPSVEDGKIVFNESFRLPVTLLRDMSVKSGGAHVFHKNLLEFSLYEPRRDKTLKGQLLGTAIVDVAEYGIFRETIAVNATISCTRSFGNSVQPILHLKIQAYDRARAGSNVSLRGKLVKETLLDNNDVDSVSALMSEEYADEAEIGSFTDDDVSSHSSHTASSAVESSGASPLHNKEIGSGRVKCHSDLSSNQGKTNKIANTLSDASDLYSELNLEKVSSISGQSQKSTRHISEEVVSPISNSEGAKAPEKLNSEHDIQLEDTRGSERRLEISERKSSFVVAPSVDVELKYSEKHGNNDLLFFVPAEEKCIVGNASTSKLSSDVMEKRIFSGSDSNFSRDRVRHVKSVRSSMESSRSYGLAMRQETNIADRKSTSSDSKIQGLEQRVKILERELREVAALEVALYSVVAEHGSSTNKVHAPARRLSRLYLRPSKGMKRASAAQSVVSGLIVVAKACGNDVPRLTFWLSNCVVLRAIVSEAFTEEQQRNDEKEVNQKPFALKWKVTSFDKQANRSFINGNLDYEDPYSFMSALEKVECWIFSRIVESVWWQTLTPHMQASAAQMIDTVVDPGFQKKYRRSSSSGGQERVNLSLELWQKAFKDACERLCPLRAAGHECGCLTVLSKLIMEQCVARLDVAMFNAILRKSADDIPTDPVSDPISDAKVLPIPAGKSSFGSGAQLKNAIGNWSRWLSDLFGMDDDDPSEDKSDNYMDDGSEGPKLKSSFKSFYLLKSLSDLMMLPKDMLMNETVRREVCPTFGTQLIKRVLDMFVPDEFCSEQVPDAVFEALDPESTNGDNEELVTYYPIIAPAVHYSPPLLSSLEFVVGGNLGTSSAQLRRSGSVLRRSNTSDDELDELDSPLHSIFGDELPAQKRNWKLMQNHQKNTVRYKLLREVWDDEAES